MARRTTAAAKRPEYKVTDNVLFEGARIIFRNFKGEESPYNKAGKRNFCVVIEDELFAERLAADGWNIKVLKPREEGDKPVHYIPVEVSYKFYPPKVYQLTETTKTKLDEESIENLDFADIKKVDLTIRPHNWLVNGKTGVKAYLKNMYVTINEDVLDKKYANYGSNGIDDDDVEEDELPF